MIGNLLAAASRQGVPTSNGQTHRTLVFEDTFEGGVLNPTKWHPEVRQSHGNRLQYYTDRPTNVRVEDDKLVIEVHRETYGGQQWTSGSISSAGHHEFLYGRVEVRAKTPVLNGFWPAIWTLGQSFWLFQDGAGGVVERGYSPGAICGEIDIMESWGQQAGSSSIAHYAPYQTTASTAFTHDRNEWNVYALEWTPTHLGFSVNDSNPLMYPIGHIAPFHIPHHLILNVAMDSLARSGTIDPATMSGKMEVDWVRVWAPEGEPLRVPLEIALDQEAVILAAGTYTFVGQTITPARAHDQGTAWITSDPAVAEAGNGWIKGVAPGSCVVTARTWNGVDAAVAVTVTP